MARKVTGRRRGGSGKLRTVAALAGAGLSGWWLLRKLRARARVLEGQVALVTGGSRGLGFLIARELVQEGCRVVICARDRDELDRARHELASGGGEVLALPCDVGDRAQVDRLVADVVRQLGGIDTLVNNAGIIQVSPLESLRLEDFEAAMRISFWGTVYMTMAAMPHMYVKKSGRVVNITSIGGKVAVPHLLPYDCAKFAAVGFSEGLRAELAKHGVSVTTVVPGLMRTGSHRFARFRGPAERRWFSVAATLPGLTMSPRRAARLVVEATKRRDAEIVLGLPAKVLRIVDQLLPSATARALSVANRLLPAPSAP